MNEINIKPGDQFTWNEIECVVIVAYEMSVLCLRNGTTTGRFGVPIRDAVNAFINKPCAMNMPVCERCEDYTSETYECERCSMMIGSCCQAQYNQFSQIDYNCCKGCAEINND